MIDFSTISIPSDILIRPCTKIDATGPLVFLQTSLAASVPPDFKALSTSDKSFSVLVVAKFKYMILGLFKEKLNKLLSQYTNITSFDFFRLVHIAYDFSIGDTADKKVLFYHIHNHLQKYQI